MAHEPLPTRRPIFGHRAVALMCLVALAIVGTLTPPFHWASTTLVVLIGLAALVLALFPPSTVRFPSVGRTDGGEMGGTSDRGSVPVSDRPGMSTSGVPRPEQRAGSGAAEPGSIEDVPDSLRAKAMRRGVVVWWTLLAAILAWQGYAYVRQPDRSIAHYDYPTLSTLIDPVLEQGPLRLLGWLAWLAAGWWLVRR
ncbi:hypothetical protein ACFXNW_25560 [Nocardia sp. NPDC059180]|uniref:hypothetical protein n=1 Tax=Nocardia sp. NPDC059180 TaxID=3346761 RepID=UPI00368CD2AF